MQENTFNWIFKIKLIIGHENKLQFIKTYEASEKYHFT